MAATKLQDNKPKRKYERKTSVSQDVSVVDAQPVYVIADRRESLYNISLKHNIPLEDLVALNGDASLYAGKHVRLR